MRSHLTYRQHTELAAGAMQRLLGHPAMSSKQGHVERMLACRDIIVSSLGERLDVLGEAAPTRQGAYPAGGCELGALTTRSREDMTRLARVLVRLPRVAPEQPESPLDVLQGQSTDPTVELWREAASSVTSATAVLSESQDKPWECDDGAAWRLAKDVAVLTEAVVVIDAELDELGILLALTPSPGDSPHVPRFVVNQCGLEAKWRATNDAPEMTSCHDDAVEVGQPRPVIQAADLPAAQRNIADSLRMHQGWPGPGPGPAITLATARSVLMMQRSSAVTSAQWARAFPDLRMLHPDLKAVEDMLTDVGTYLRAVREKVSQLPSRAVMLQTKNIFDAVGRMRIEAHANGTPPISPLELVNWVQAQHQTNVSLGEALCLEMRRGNTNLEYVVLGHTMSPPPARRSPLDRAVAHLIQAPAPAVPASRLVGPCNALP